jgi:hypothetical protein
MSTRSEISFAINALIIITTIYAQDFRDEVGDKRMGRRTIAIVWPEGSRISIFMVLVGWSVGLSWACELGSFFSVPFCVLAMFVGLRFLRKRTKEADQRSYRYYNVRLVNRSVIGSGLTFCRLADMACCCASRTCPCDRIYALTVMIHLIWHVDFFQVRYLFPVSLHRRGSSETYSDVH